MTESGDTPVGKTPKSDLWRILPGILVSLIAIAILFSIIDLDQFLNDLKKADFGFLPSVIIIFLISLITRAMGWRAILQDKISVSKAFWTINEGYLLNNLLPFRLGEVGRAFLINQTTGISIWEVIPSIVIERIFDVAFTAGMLLASLPFVIGAEDSQGAASAVVILVMVGFVVLYLAARNKDLLLTWFDRLAARISILNRFGRERISSILEGIASLSDPKRFLRVLFWMGTTWALTIGLYYILLIAYDPNAKL
ncbi:MAG: flippase-like domain-containing protein, partial [Chloroflexota bacterium]